MSPKPQDDQYSDKEIAERMERGLRRSLQMPHTPHQPKKKERPASKGRVRKGKSRS